MPLKLLPDEPPTAPAPMGPTGVPNMGGIRTAPVAPVQAARQPALRTNRPGPRPTPSLVSPGGLGPPPRPDPRPTPRPMGPPTTSSELPPPAPNTYRPGTRIPVMGRADPRAGAFFNKLVPRAEAHPNRPNSQAILSAVPGGNYVPPLPPPPPNPDPRPIGPPQTPPTIPPINPAPMPGTKPKPPGPYGDPGPLPPPPSLMGGGREGGHPPGASDMSGISGMSGIDPNSIISGMGTTLGGQPTPSNPGSPGAQPQVTVNVGSDAKGGVSQDAKLRDGYPDAGSSGGVDQSLVGGRGAHGYPGSAPQPQPQFATPEQIQALQPGQSVEHEFGTVTHDPQTGRNMLKLNPQAKARYQAAHQQLRAKFKHFSSNPDAPQPNLIPGKPNYNPFTGEWL